jgi:16S rRNA (cytosine1402-N4)-methyltransferase
MERLNAEDKSADNDALHAPVMKDRIIELFTPALTGEAVVVDATLGMGGHTEALLSTFPHLTVIGLDRDLQAIDLASARLKDFGDRFKPVHAVYDEIAEVVDDLGIDPIAGALFDLGVSSLQLDEADRGFAYSKDAPLDMRMDQSQGITAAEVLNTYEPGQLVRILREFGEEKFATRIVSAVVKERQKEPFHMSGRLVELLYAAVPAASRRTGGHPAKRTFQALRIEVNSELSVLSRAIPAALESLAVGGRLVVESYQSLEDRIVKQTLASWAASTTPAGLPVDLPGHGPKIRLLTRGAEQADETEISMNPRAASVRLRAAERMGERA